MATDPKRSVSPNSSPEPMPDEIRQALAGGLGDFSLRELLSFILSSLGQAERQTYQVPGLIDIAAAGQVS